MPKYKESTKTGKTWQRAGKIVIDYPTVGFPTVTFFEQEAMQAGDAPPVMRDVGELSVQITPAKMIESIPLRDITTGELNGDVTTFAAVAQAIFSAYYKAGLDRDGA